MKKKTLVSIGAIIVLLMLLVNFNLLVKNNAIEITFTTKLSMADFDPCPVDPIPWHCSWTDPYEVCFYSNRCFVTCGGC